MLNLMPSIFKAISHKQSTISNKSKGFTLIELLVVIAIIGILATIIVASFTSAQARGRDSRRKADLDAVKKALELYKLDTLSARYYAPTIGTGGPTGPLVTGSVQYIKSVPVDPKTNVVYSYSIGGSAGCSPSACTDYRLLAELENTGDPQYAQSQTQCPHPGGGYTPATPAYNTSGPTRTYVVCNP